MPLSGWEHSTTKTASTSPSVYDLHWAAGFLEGEACFGSNQRTPQVQVAQVQKFPVDQLLRFFGGSLARYPARGRSRQLWRWSVCGARARGLMMTLYSLMSPDRQTQILAALKRKSS